MAEIKVIWSDSDIAYIATSEKYPLLSGIAPRELDALEELKIAIELAKEVEREDNVWVKCGFTRKNDTI